jgi:hypothetical protein
MRNHLELGKWNVVCDRCGLKHKNDELQKEWTGLMVCKPCFETRHPQTLLRVPEENPAVPWVRPEPADVFIDVDYVASDVGTQT